MRFCEGRGHFAVIPDGDETCLVCQAEGRMTADIGHSWVGFRCERCGIAWHETDPCPAHPDYPAIARLRRLGR